MTNEEAIKDITDAIQPQCGGKSLEMAIEAIKENETLKVEIEQLKTRLEIKDNNFELYSDALDKIEQLKEQLDMKNPCYECIRYEQCGYQKAQCGCYERALKEKE